MTKQHQHNPLAIFGKPQIPFSTRILNRIIIYPSFAFFEVILWFNDWSDQITIEIIICNINIPFISYLILIFGNRFCFVILRFPIFTICSLISIIWTLHKVDNSLKWTKPKEPILQNIFLLYFNFLNVDNSLSVLWTVVVERNVKILCNFFL